MRINSISDGIGKTPLLRLSRFAANQGIDANVYGKLEGMNPSGSVKDRAALYMIDEAEKAGELAKGGTIVEPTSGNTGIGIAEIASARGYRAIIVMPESMSYERRAMIAAYGAEIVLTPASEGMQGSVDRAKQIVSSIKGAFMPEQFDNENNTKAHYETTGPEIWEDLGGEIDIFVAGFGTGGTISGVGRYLKEKNADIQIVAVEPASSPVMSKGQAGPHKIQGIGANFVPAILDGSVIDEIITVEDESAYKYADILAKTEGYLAGISSGAALAAAETLAKRDENLGKTIVTILADGGSRYMSVHLFGDVDED